MPQRPRVRDIIAQILPVILLIFYVFAIGTAVSSTLRASERCHTDRACADAFHAKRAEGVNLILNLVGGLVSALVIAELAITQPGEFPSAQILRRRQGKSQKLITVISTAFIIVWVLGGAAAVLMYVLYPTVIPATLSEFAKAWLGLALASAYSYLGIK